MDFVTGLLISANKKGDSYNSILVIVNQLTKIVYYEPVKVTINVPGLVEVIITIVVCYYWILELIVIDWDLFFTSKFWSSLWYFLEIKKKLFTALYPNTNGQTERQNSIIEA